MDFILEEMNKVGADGVDFVPIWLGKGLPPIHCSYTKEEWQHVQVYPKSNRMYWKMIDGKKEYIDEWDILRSNVMIYTSYFAKLKSLPENVIPISICGKAPDWYKGLQYKKLAPKYDFFMKWKEDHDNDYYIKCFSEQVLDKLDVIDVIIDLSKMVYGFNAGKKDVCLICYEKSSDFCHRHLVADWLNKNGFKCEEWSK